MTDSERNDTDHVGAEAPEDEGRLPGEGLAAAADARSDGSDQARTIVENGTATGEPHGTTIREPETTGEEVGVTVRDTAPAVEQVGTTVREAPVDER